MRTCRRKRKPSRCSRERTIFSGVVSLPRMRDMFQLRRAAVSRSLPFFTGGIVPRGRGGAEKKHYARGHLRCSTPHPLIPLPIGCGDGGGAAAAVSALLATGTAPDST